MKAIRYLASLDYRRVVLWCAFLWYAMIAVRFAERDAAIWLRALGITAIVGAILMLNAVPPNGRLRDVGLWPALRFFLIPFCVSSFSAMTKQHAFWLIFPLSLIENVAPACVVAAFGCGVWVIKKFSASVKTQTAIEAKASS